MSRQRTNTATVRLQTTGSFVHKEYRPDGHLLLIDLSGVTTDPSLVRTVMFRSPVLKSYTLSSYTSAAGIAVTRVEITLGDNVTADVIDASDGLQVLLSGGESGAASAAASSTAGTSLPAPVAAAVATPKPASEENANSSHPLPQNTMPVAQKAGTQPAAVVNASAPAAETGRKRGALTPAVIRSVSVRRGQDTLDVVVDGPSSAHPYLLTHPDRVVLDFNNAVMQPAVRKTIAVHTKDVLRVRVGRFQAAPPVTRVVIDLSGPRGYDVEPSADQVVVRVKTEVRGNAIGSVQGRSSPGSGARYRACGGATACLRDAQRAESGCSQCRDGSRNSLKGSHHARGQQHTCGRQYSCAQHACTQHACTQHARGQQRACTQHYAGGQQCVSIQ